MTYLESEGRNLYSELTQRGTVDCTLINIAYTAIGNNTFVTLRSRYDAYQWFYHIEICHCTVLLSHWYMLLANNSITWKIWNLSVLLSYSDMNYFGAFITLRYATGQYFCHMEIWCTGQYFYHSEMRNLL